MNGMTGISSLQATNDEIDEMNTILVVAAHPDDEALGCGGTIAKRVAEGDEVHLLFVADGVGARGGDAASASNQRQRACDSAAEILSVSSISHLGFPDNKLDSVPLLDVIQRIEQKLAEILPSVVYTHHPGDLNVDHRLTCEAVMTACRPLPGSSVNEIYFFEVISSSEWSLPGAEVFSPNVFEDITGYLETKMKALEAYAEEMRPAPHSRSYEHLRSLALHRGHSVGFDAAEAFVLARQRR